VRVVAAVSDWPRSRSRTPICSSWFQRRNRALLARLYCDPCSLG
jgi:hypothetical protein